MKPGRLVMVMIHPADNMSCGECRFRKPGGPDGPASCSLFGQSTYMPGDVSERIRCAQCVSADKLMDRGGRI
jgi:hypothetical protein